MECLQIDWKNLDHTFERDDFYENIQAPKWIDFTVPLRPVDDHEWFCGKAGCTHVKPPEDQFQQKNLCLQASKKVPPLVESTLSVAPGKRAREVVASSYSSMSSIKEAFAKHKLLHAAKPSVAESNKQATIKRSMHASENQKPNQACEVLPGASKAPTLKATDVLAAKKPKTTGNKQFFGITESMVLSEQKNRSQNRAALDVSKSMTSIGKKDLGLKRSMASTTDAKVEETAGPTATVHTFEPNNKRAEASRMPFSTTYPTSRTALTSSLAFPSRRPIYPARSIQNVQLDNNKPVLCRPPRVVVRKDHKVGVEQVLMPDKQASVDNAASSNVEDQASRDVETNAIMMLQQQCSTLDHESFLKYDGKLSRDCNEDDEQLLRDCKEDDGQLPRDCKEDEEKDEDMHALASEDWQSVEQHLKSLCLATPGKKLTSNGSANPEHTDNPQKQEVVLHPEDSQHVTNAVELETVLSQYGHGAAGCTMDCSSKGAAEHEEVLITDCIHSGQAMESQMNESSASSMDITEEQGGLSIGKKMEKKDDQLQPVKGWHNNRGLKRKSCELNFKVNCSAKDHRHETHKVSSSVAFISSLLCQQAKPVSMLRSPLKAPPSLGCFDSCKEQHKKMKITKVQPFKPFRLRTEERGALKELGIGKKEQGASNPQELVHHALRMPSFGHPFRPQRSTKKLTIPKEPNFHTRTRKACTTRHHTTMIAS